MSNIQRSIFLDFDGTLIDSRERQYTLFQELAQRSSLTFDEYWSIKRERVDQQKLLTELLLFTKEEIEKFRSEWKNEIEKKSRLLQDKPFPGVGEFLGSLKRDGFSLHLVTARQKSELVEWQLNLLGWFQHFDRVLVTRQIESKEALVRRSVSFNSSDFFIGDTGEDIQTAKKLGIRSIAISSGVLSAYVLREYDPDFLCENINEIYESGLLRLSASATLHAPKVLERY